MSLALSLLFFVSGAAALIFETLWFRQAGLSFGNGVWASSIVLGSFMAGLALGNGLAAWAGGRILRPIRFYAAVEAVIAISGVALVWLLPRLGEFLAPLLQTLEGAPLLLNFFRLGSGFLLLLVPATAMGATLPLLVKALLAHDTNFGAALGRLYGWNTLGAVVGALAGEGVLLEGVGIYGTAFVAGALDLGAALGALALARTLEAQISTATAPSPARLTVTALRCCAAAFVAGGIFLAFEVVWFRFLSLFVWPTPVTFALMLAVVLSGIGLGGFAGGRSLRRFPDAHAHARTLAFAAGVVSVASYGGFALVVEPYGLSYLQKPRHILWLSAALMLPLSLVTGCLFTWIGAALDRVVSPETRSAGWLVLANTLGAGLGSLLAGFVLLPFLGMSVSFLVLAAMYGGVALSLPGRPAERESRVPRALGYAAAAGYGLALLLFPLDAMEDRYLARVVERYSIGRDVELVARREGRTETIQYMAEPYLGERLYLRMLTDGFSMSASDERGRRYMKLYVWWPVALAEPPQSALLISFGVGSTAKALTDTKSLFHIDVVDISREVLDLASVVFPDDAENPLHDPRVTVHVDDGRYFLRSTSRRYDLITGEPPPPKMSGIVNLYTREYFELVYDHLNEGGIHTYWLPVHSLTVADAKSIIAAYCAVFEDCSLWNGNGLDWMLVGTRGARWHRSAERLRAFFEDPEVRPELVATGIERPEQLGALFLADADGLRARVADVPPLTDAWPKRLSSDPGTGHRSAFLAWMEPDAAHAAFLASAFVRKLWPPELDEAAARAFAWQRVINGISSRERVETSLVERIRDLHRVLTTTDLETLPLWLMGSGSDQQRIVRARAQGGVPDSAQPRQMALAALSERRFEDAADLYEQLLARMPKSPRILLETIYAEALAGRLDRAGELTREVAPQVAKGEGMREALAWLEHTFDLAPHG